MTEAAPSPAKTETVITDSLENHDAFQVQELIVCLFWSGQVTI